MARARGILTNLNDEISLEDRDEINGAASIQYGAGGLGTVVMEQTNNDAEWVQLKMKNPSTAVNAEVDNLAAAGIAYAEIVGASKVRARKSVAGAGPVTVVLTLKNS